MEPGDRRPPRRLRVEVLTAGTRRRAPGLATWLARVAPATARGEVTIALVTDAKIRTLNRQYRRKDAATDVLSFPSEPAVGGGRWAVGRRQPARERGGRSTADRRPPTAGAYLGDIVIAAGVAARQAKARGHALGTELRVLALHGLLHLLGYDHESATDRGRMARVEKRLRERGGLNEGLIERAPRVRSPKGGTR